MTKRPIKILHVVFSLEPGGMENGLVNVARALSPKDFEVHVCCLERGGSFIQRLPETSKVHVLHKTPGFSLRTVRRLSRLLREIHPDVVHSHNLGPLIYSGFATFRGRRCSIVQGEHSLLASHECVPRRIRLRRFFYGGCHAVHSVSGELRDQLVSLGMPAQKIAVLANGVDTQRFHPGPKQKARQEIGNFPDDAIVLGIVGRFGPFKRHSLLIESFEKLAATRPQARLLIVGGGGPEESRVREQVQASSLAGRIHWAGFQNQLTPFYQAMDLLVMPSVNEGMSNAVLEAMACGVPVLANKICGNAEIISDGHDGILADLNSGQSLTDHLHTAIADVTRLESMGRAARETVVRRFGIDVMVENYKALYRAAARRATP